MKRKNCYLYTLLLATVALKPVNAQNAGVQRGAQVIEQQAAALQAYFTFIYVIAAIVGLVGGFRIYSKWQNGDRWYCLKIQILK